jgi:class 3 adenylate cyclase
MAEEEQKAKEKIKNDELQGYAALLDVENKKISVLLGEILPPTVCKQLLNGQTVEPEVFPSTTLLYFDIVGYTKLSAQVGPLEVVTLLNELYERVDQVISQYDVYKVETIGELLLIQETAF